MKLALSFPISKKAKKSVRPHVLPVRFVAHAIGWDADGFQLPEHGFEEPRLRWGTGGTGGGLIVGRDARATRKNHAGLRIGNDLFEQLRLDSAWQVGS